MKIAVTGGAGFIGSNFIHYILKNRVDYKVINIDFLTYAGNLDNLKSIESNKNYKFYKADIRDKAKLNSIFESEKFDWVINFAAESHVDRSIKDPDVCCCTEFCITRPVWQKMHDAQKDILKSFSIQDLVEKDTADQRHSFSYC